MEPSKPVILTEYSPPVRPRSVGEQLVVATTVQSHVNDTRGYATIIEVRDSNGMTEMLGWQTGQISPNGSMGIGISWTPLKADTYQLRTFVLSGLDNPQVYSPVVSSEVTIVNR
jgi:hypothetical protein